MNFNAMSNSQIVLVVVIVLLIKANYNFYGEIRNMYSRGFITNRTRKWLMITSFIIPLIGLIFISYFSFTEGRKSNI